MPVQMEGMCGQQPNSGPYFHNSSGHVQAHFGKGHREHGRADNDANWRPKPMNMCMMRLRMCRDQWLSRAGGVTPKKEHSFSYRRASGLDHDGQARVWAQRQGQQW